jgi:hypothetical protein
MPTESTPALDADLAAFVQGPVMLDVAACSAGLMPATARALGCRLSDDRARLRLMVAPSQGAALLAHARAQGMVAAVFSDPDTRYTVQMKGTDAAIEAPDSADRATVARYRAQFVPFLGQLGYDETVANALLACAADDLAVLSFTPSRAYSQTPGPNAGQALLVQP